MARIVSHIHCRRIWCQISIDTYISQNGLDIHFGHTFGLNANQKEIQCNGETIHRLMAHDLWHTITVPILGVHIRHPYKG